MNLVVHPITCPPSPPPSPHAQHHRPPLSLSPSHLSSSLPPSPDSGATAHKTDHFWPAFVVLIVLERCLGLCWGEGLVYLILPQGGGWRCSPEEALWVAVLCCRMEGLRALGGEEGDAEGGGVHKARGGGRRRRVIKGKEEEGGGKQG